MAGDGTEVDWQYGVGLVIPDERLTLDEAGSTYTERNPVPGVVEPQNSSDLTVKARGNAPTTGATAAEKVLQMMSQQGGLVGGTDPARMIWRQGTTGDWFGHNDQSMSAHQVVVSEGATWDGATYPCARTLRDGTCLVLYFAQHASVAPRYRLVCGKLALDGTFTGSNVRTNTAAPSSPYNAALCPLSSGRILAFSWNTDSGSETAQVRMDYSDDDGTTWAMGKEACLPDAIDVSASGYALGRLRAAEIDGGISLVAGVIAATALVSVHRNHVWQYASRDIGNKFVLLDTTDEDNAEDGVKGGAQPEIIVTEEGHLFACWISPETQHIHGQIIDNAFDSLFDETPIDVDSTAVHAASTGTPSLLSDVELGLCQDHGGPLYVTARLTSTAARASHALRRSVDGGESWASMGYGKLLVTGGATWWRSHDEDVTPASVTMAAHDGRLVVFANAESPAGVYDSSLRAIAIGGPTTVPNPPYRAADQGTLQVTTGDYTWVAIDAPEESGYTTGPTGAATVTETDEYIEYAASSQQGYTTDTLPGTSSTATDGWIGRRVLSVESGGSLTATNAGIVVEVEDATNSYKIAIRMTTTGARVYDVHGAAAIGSDVTGLSASTLYEWKIALGDGKVRTWYREWSWSGKTAWTAGPTSASVTDGGAGAGNQVVIEWPVVDSGTATVRIYEHGNTWDTYVGTHLVDVQTNPDDLRGREWSSLGVPVGPDGVIVSASGATVRGDEFHAKATSATPIENLLKHGPRVGWEAADETEQTITYDLGGGDDSATGTDVLVIAGFAANVTRMLVYGVPETGSDVLLGTADLCDGLDDLHFTTSGDTVRPDPSAGSDTNAPLASLAEFAGCQFSFDSSETRKIRFNRGGKWTKDARRRDVIFVKDADGTEPASGTGGKIIPCQWAIAIDMRGAEYEKLKLVIPAPDASTRGSAEGRWRIGRLVVGYLVTHAHLPSWGNKVTARANTEILKTRDAQKSGTELAPIARTFRIGFVDGTSVYNVINTDGDEDPRWFNVSDHADAQGMGTPGLELHSWGGILIMTKGGTLDMAYLPHIARFDGSTRLHVYNKAPGLAYLTWLDSEISWERVTGLRMHGELLRGDVVELPELV